MGVEKAGQVVGCEEKDSEPYGIIQKMSQNPKTLLNDSIGKKQCHKISPETKFWIYKGYSQ